MKKRVLLTLIICCNALAQANEWHALVLGANKYENNRFITLNGAVNDAELIAKSLQQQGVHPTLLTNNEISYDAVTNWWGKTLNDLAPGDVVFFSFAGHGARQPEQFPGSEAANAEAEGLVNTQNLINKNINNPLSAALQLDEVLVLPGYRNEGAASRERLVDDELLDWFKKATDKGATVIAVADACYGGGQVRSALSGRDYSDTLAVARNSSGDILEPEDQTLRGTADSARLRVSDGDQFANRLFYAIPLADETKAVDEKVINGQPHGLLSYLMAQVLAGKTIGADGAPLKMAKDIGAFLRRESLSQSSRTQEAYLIGVNQHNRDVVLIPGHETAPDSNTVDADSTAVEHAPSFTVFADGDCDHSTADAALYRWVSDPHTAAFRWSCDTGRVVKSGVGVVAYDVNNIRDLRSFLNQQVLVRQIQALPLPHFRGIVLPSQQTDLADTSVKVFEEGDDVSVYFAAPSDLDMVFALNLPSQGGIQLVHAAPLRTLQHLPERKANDGLDTLLGSTTVIPPFGNDYLLLVAMPRDVVMETSFFHHLLTSGQLPSKLDNAAELLLTLEDLTPEQAALSIIPFATVRP